MARHLKITVEGKAYDVIVEDVTDDDSSLYPPPSMASMARPAAPAAAPAASPAPAAAPAAGGAAPSSANDKAAPMGGTVLEVCVKVGDQVKAGDQVVIIEAMKMKQMIAAHRDGKVSHIHVEAGQVVDAGQALLTID